jgi:phosphate transport system protein
MAKHLQRDLDGLSRELLTMGAMVEEATNKAITALVKRRKELAREVIAGDGAINEKENRIEEEALKILALHQPVAQDLRFIVTALKVNNDLERMGDLAANICERCETLIDLDPVPFPESFNEMVEHVQFMVRDCLNALVDRDAALAREVYRRDDLVDAIHREMYTRMQEAIKENPTRVEACINILSVSRQLERIADGATNIAEDVIFMVEGEIVRHNL